MPTSFASYDLDQDGQISVDEWSQFYAMDEGPGSDPAAPPEPFDLDTFLGKMASGDFTDDDLMAFSNWYMGQQVGLQAGQLDLANRRLDYDLQALGLNEMQIETAKQEIEFQQGPYWDWYTTEYFPNQQERDRMDIELQRYNLDTQKALGEIEQGKAKDYALAQFYGTEQAKLGAEAARYQWMQMLEQQPRQGNAGSNQRDARARLGGY